MKEIAIKRIIIKKKEIWEKKNLLQNDPNADTTLLHILDNMTIPIQYNQSAKLSSIFPT